MSGDSNKSELEQEQLLQQQADPSGSSSASKVLQPSAVAISGSRSVVIKTEEYDNDDTPKNESTLDPDMSASLSGVTYGNYLTVSGTGANILKDLFHRNYRAKAVEQTVDEKEPKKKISFGQTTFFGVFRSKKDKGGGIPFPEMETPSKSVAKGHKDSRGRHKSEPERATNSTGLDVQGKSKHGKMKTFLESLWTSSKSESVDDAHSSDLMPVKQSRAPEHEVKPKSRTGKEKKFRVTLAKKDMVIGPDEFVEMYRSRAFSDTCPRDIIAARAAARHHKLSADGLHTPLATRDSNGFGNKDDKRHFVVWRDKKKGTKIFQLPRACSVRDEFGDPDDANFAYTRFMKAHTCYDLIPNSSKLVIFDTQLTVKKAFIALVHNRVRAAVLWDTAIQAFIGMLTITDFIQVLMRYYHSSQEQLDEVENNKISTWKEILNCQRRMVCIDPECHLLDTVHTLVNNKVHRLLVLDDIRGNPLNLLSHKRLLRFLYQNMSHLQRPLFMDKTLEELQVGTYENLATLISDAPVIEALRLFVERRISAIPIVNSKGQVVDIFAKIDIVSLIDGKLYSNLDVSVVEILKAGREKFQGVLTCRKTETLQKVVDRIAISEVHRLVVVDEAGVLEGIVSLSDILNYLILVPAESKVNHRSSEQSVGDTESSSNDITVAANLSASQSSCSELQGVDGMQVRPGLATVNVEESPSSLTVVGSTGSSDVSVFTELKSSSLEAK